MLRRLLRSLALTLAVVGAAHAQTVSDPSLTVELVTSGLSLPTTMAFVAPDDILVLEKGNGTVRRVKNGVLSPTPALTVPVNTSSERGMLGIAVNTETPRKVFLYYTEAATPGGSGTPLGNRVYRYTWNAGTGLLESPVLVLDLPVTGGPNHDGGIVLLGPPGQAPGVGDGALLYAVIGDLNRSGQLQNFPGGAAPDDTSVILRVRQDGTPAPGNPFTPYCSLTTTATCTSDASCPGGETCQLQVRRYYAYGVRNSFGMTLDPVTGALWDTENGPSSYDEVNRVAAGTNSGWVPIMGPDSRNVANPSDLFAMPGGGSTYHDPEFSWLFTIAPTAIVFPRSSSLGPAYDQVALVGDNNLGQLYRFPLNGSRTAFDVAGVPGLADLVADDATERDALRFGQGFGVITDLEQGPDRHLYLVSLSQGAIYRVRGAFAIPALPVWGPLVLAGMLVAGVWLFGRARGGPRGQPRPARG
jgi:glucose/arabinose dehydrogenase